eukprot:CAMPEP_0185378886 /NCGR_PEP_ID=MMETSP1364-20130426/46375_1 /TAXON_ID=38817 /ORGANISM="Gephyrocapsa oceanica, Strain RCC1303" /LENGTH=286 /DNA_ID=CAMNT_0027980443 /DNA_START=137 /DNA_END=997 /DNA_ORIENTATION=+
MPRDGGLEMAAQPDVVVRARLQAVAVAQEELGDARVLADDDVDAHLAQVDARERLHLVALDVEREEVDVAMPALEDDGLQRTALHSPHAMTLRAALHPAESLKTRRAAEPLVKAHARRRVGDARWHKRTASLAAETRVVHRVGLDQEPLPVKARIEEVRVRAPDRVVRGEVDVRRAAVEVARVVVPDPPILALARHPREIRLRRTGPLHLGEVRVAVQVQRHSERRSDVCEWRDAAPVILRFDELMAPPRRAALHGVRRIDGVRLSTSVERERCERREHFSGVSHL